MARGRARAADGAAIVALVLAAVLLYRPVLGLFWIYDTPFHLGLLSRHPLGDFFFSRGPWLEEKNVFTPLFFLSLALDRAVGGLDPSFYYLHQLAVLAAGALALYAALRLWLAPSFAAAGAGLFLLGPSVAASAPLLMVRHYFEALVLSSLAVAAFVLAVRRERRGWSLVSAGCYFAALLAKEIAAPLVVLAAFLPEAGWRRRLRLLVPHAVVLAAYALYRIAMLARPLSGHGWIDPRGTLGAVLALPRDLLAPLLGRSPLAAVVLLLGVACGLAALPRRGRAAILATVAASLVAVVPVSFEMQPRFLLTAWTVLAAGAAAGWSRWAASSTHPRLARAAPWIAGLTLVAGAAAGRAAWAGEYGLARRMSVENRALLALDAGAALRHPASATSTLHELQALRPDAERARWYQDDLFLCAAAPPPRRVVTYDEPSGAMRDVSAPALAEGAAFCRSLDERSPLTARFAWTGDGLVWELGPDADSGYSFVLDEGITRIAVPRRGGYGWLGDSVSLRVRHAGPDGRPTYSPTLRLDRRAGETVWRR
jgi:hypothetical protein